MQAVPVTLLPTATWCASPTHSKQVHGGSLSHATNYGHAHGLGAVAGRQMFRKEFRRILRERHGIKSNHVGEEWTGVSLARWKELVECLKSMNNAVDDSEVVPNDYDDIEKLLTTAIWSMAVWESCCSRQCILDYLLAINEVSGERIWNETNPFVQRGIQTDTEVQQSWVSMENDDHRFEHGNIQSQLEGLLQRLPAEHSSSSLEIAGMIESLCTSIQNRTQSKNVKPTTPNGYYGFHGAEVKPDCVEVAVRELLDYMLWEDEVGKFDLPRLPESTTPELASFYQSQTAVENGQEWFDLMSDIPGCLYLSSNSNGRSYELTPTLRNMAKVCKRLLYNDGDPSKPLDESDDWESLSRLEEAWGPQDVTISFGTYSEKAKMSPDIIVHEVALVKREGKPNAIELRLRCDWERNTGFATVTHMRLQEDAIDGDVVDDFLRFTLEGEGVNPIGLLVLSFLGDHGVLREDSQLNLTSMIIPLLSSRYGVDRREMLHITATSDLEREELAYRKAFRESQKVLKSAILKACNGSVDRERGILRLRLLCWIMNENPIIDPSVDASVSRLVPDKEVEQGLLALPNTIKLKQSFKAQASKNWAIRGHVWRKLLDHRSGKTSFFKSIMGLKITDWPRFVLLNRRLQ